jgi:hypothetical protein
MESAVIPITDTNKGLGNSKCRCLGQKGDSGLIRLGCGNKRVSGYSVPFKSSFSATLLGHRLVHGMADPENHIDRILGESKECLTAWKQLYKAAVLETNMDLVPRRVQEARKAAGERAMHLIREPADDDLELQDLVYTSRGLDELNRKCQSARDSKPK